MAPPDVLTPEQVAEYLQINRETVYRYIRDGKLAASKLGRSYRISRRDIELLLLATRTRPDIPIRIYSDEEIAEFLKLDELDDESRAIISRFEEALMDKNGS